MFIQITISHYDSLTQYHKQSMVSTMQPHSSIFLFALSYVPVLHLPSDIRVCGPPAPEPRTDFLLDLIPITLQS